MEGPARMTGEPLPDLLGLVSGIIVENDMDCSVLGDFALDPVEETNKLLMPLALYVLSDNSAIERIERGNQCWVPCRLSSWVMVARRPCFIGRPGWVRSSAWSCDFSSIDKTTA